MMDTSRITGLASGMDTEALVKSMVANYQTKVDLARQGRQYARWQQEAYREVIGDLRGFQSQFLDFLNPDNCLLSESTFNAYKTVLTGGGAGAITATATSTAGTASHTMSNIKMAKKDVWKGENVASMVGKGLDLGAINAGDKLNIAIDDTVKTITLDRGYNNINDLIDDLNDKIEDAFGSGKVTVSESGGELSFESKGHHLELLGSDPSTAKSALGFDMIAQNTLKLNVPIEYANFTKDIFGGGDTVKFSINGEEFSFDKSSYVAVNDIINEVNKNSNANVTMSYSELTNSFTITSNREGINGRITFEDIEGSFLSSGIGIDMADPAGNTQVGSDAEFTLDDVETTRSSNNFKIDGINYTIKEDTTETIHIGIETDTQDVKDTIVKFVDEYNKMIEKFNDLLTEEKEYEYKPLTDAQKEEMSEKEIERWEEKAKSGILRSDTTLRKVMSDMRKAVTRMEEEIGVGLYDFGITTSKDYLDGGKLVIDEDKLDTALNNNLEDVKRLFADDEHGIASKLKDAVDYAIKPTGEDKGVLLKKAGLEGSSTEQTNVLTKEIKEYEKRIKRYLEDLEIAENMYYAKFAAMEAALQSLNQQSSWLSSQLG